MLESLRVVEAEQRGVSEGKAGWVSVANDDACGLGGGANEAELATTEHFQRAWLVLTAIVFDNFRVIDVFISTFNKRRFIYEKNDSSSLLDLQILHLLIQ